MTKIEYIEKDKKDLDIIGPLWKKLNEHHKARSPHFREHYNRMTWEKRKKDLLEKSEKGSMLVDIARDTDEDRVVGYCVSTVTEKGQGEIDSIYVEESYRRQDIGDNFIKRALSWMKGLSVIGIMVEVAAGNEEVYPFYSRYGFYPGSVVLRHKERR